MDRLGRSSARLTEVFTVLVGCSCAPETLQTSLVPSPPPQLSSLAVSTNNAVFVLQDDDNCGRGLGTRLTRWWGCLAVHASLLLRLPGAACQCTGKMVSRSLSTFPRKIKRTLYINVRIKLYTEYGLVYCWMFSYGSCCKVPTLIGFWMHVYPSQMNWPSVLPCNAAWQTFNILFWKSLW